MRRLGTLGDPEAARRFAEALRLRGIPAEFRAEPGGAVAVWVLDEDRLPDARTTWDALASDGHSCQTDERQPLAPLDRVSEKGETPPTSPPRRPAWQRVPVTIGLVALSIAATLASNFGDLGSPVTSALSFASYSMEGDIPPWKGLADLRAGELWRLFTPILLHGNLIHLLGNLGALWVLGGAVESVRGSIRMLVLVLVIAAVSNYAEYWLNLGLTFDTERGLQTDTGVNPNPFFLGMSGVVFGLFGLIWMRARFVPGSRFLMPRDLVVWMLIWLLACTAGLVGAIANVAHAAGLLTGMAIGIAPRLWRRG